MTGQPTHHDLLNVRTKQVIVGSVSNVKANATETKFVELSGKNAFTGKDLQNNLPPAVLTADGQGLC